MEESNYSDDFEYRPYLIHSRRAKKDCPRPSSSANIVNGDEAKSQRTI
jgi:hypothetical protein